MKEWQPAGLGRQGTLRESNAKPCFQSWRSDDEAFAVAVSVVVHVDGLSEAHTGGDPIAKRCKDEWKSVGLRCQGTLSESNAKP
jgi:hypothetical protein